MLPFWKESPFVRILLPFMAGILCFVLYPAAQIPLFVLITLLLLALLMLFNSRKDYLKLRFAFAGGALLQLFVLSAAYLICMLHQISTSPHWYKHRVAMYSYAIGQINAAPEPKEKTLKLTVEIIHLCDSAEVVSTCGKAIIYLQHDSSTNMLRQGDHILFKNKLKDIVKSGNPGSFDYAAYCAASNIYQRAYLRAGEWKKAPGHRIDLSGFFAGVNAKTRTVLKKYIPDSNAHGVAEALLLGYRTDIDDEIWQAYTNTGIVHIIAISGMHMAMVYGSVRWLLLLLPVFKKRKSAALIIAILLMWAFAFVTGLPASVCRAAIMFTFIGWGEMQQQRSNTINTLAASAFCMLCYHPMLLLDVGFQLSYMAVLSLVVFYRPLYQCICLSGKITDAVWKLTAMTVAAQILTLPLCLYYFHQFPVLFILTNLFAVPLTTIILYAEILLVLLHFITPLAWLTGRIVSHLIVFVNSTVLHFSEFSFAVWSGIQISLLQMLMLFVFTGMLSLAFFTKKAKHLIIASACLLLFCTTLLQKQFEILRQQKIIIYNIPGESSLEFICRHKYYNANRDSLLKKNKNEVYTLKPAHTFFGVHKNDRSVCGHYRGESAEIFSFKGRKLIRISASNFYTDTLLKVDVLILSGKCNIRANWLAQSISAKQIVLDSSIPFWKIEQIKKELQHISVPLHIVSEQGAFIMNI